MALPMPPNTTCDIYRTGNAPPANPDVAGVKCYLAPKGQSTLTTPGAPTQAGYTHIMYVDRATDIRDGSQGASLLPTGFDSVFVPNKNGQVYAVVMIRRVGIGSPTDYKQVLLHRGQVTWPQDYL